MEMVLDVYRRPYDSRFPVICMDESPRQLIGEVKTPIPGAPGRPARHDYEYKRHGVCNVFMANEPLAGQRMVKITERKTRQDWAQFVADIADRYQHAEKITLVMDNLNTHTKGAFYTAFAPDVARAYIKRLDFLYTPKHGSWLNIAECELSCLSSQCFAHRRICHLAELQSEIEAWATRTNETHRAVDWQFTLDDARMRLKRLYPKFKTG